MSTPENFLLHVCPHCAGHIEFPTHGIGEEIECPHCGRRTILQQQKQLKQKHQLNTGRRSVIPFVAAGIALILAVGFGGNLFSVAKERHKARQAVKVELIALKVGLRDGLSLADVRAQRNKVNVVFELNKKDLPSTFSITILNIYLETAGYFWERQIENSAYRRVSEIDVLRMEMVLDKKDELDAVYLKSAEVALEINKSWADMDFNPNFFVTKSLTKCAKEVERLLAKLE